MTYKGVRRRKDINGRLVFSVQFYFNGKTHSFGFYKTDKECAKAYDLYVIRKGFDLETNFYKRI